MAPPSPAATSGTVFERSVRFRTMLEAVRSLPVFTPGPAEAAAVVVAVELAPRGTPVGRFVAAGLVADAAPYWPVVGAGPVGMAVPGTGATPPAT